MLATSAAEVPSQCNDSDQPQLSEPYFSQCQLPIPNSQYISSISSSVVSVEPLAASHPFHTVLKANPKLLFQHYEYYTNQWLGNDPQDTSKTSPLTGMTEKTKFDLYTVVLQSTNFFPLGGGQEYDCGFMTYTSDVTSNTQTIIPIHAVYRYPSTSYTITHIISCPKGSSHPFTHQVDQQVTLVVDFQRRWFHMTNHTSQHLLSAIMSYCFNQSTFAWTCGTYNSSLSPTVVQDVTTIEKDISSITSCIDFTNDIEIRFSHIIDLLERSLLNGHHKDQRDLTLLKNTLANICSYLHITLVNPGVYYQLQSIDAIRAFFNDDQHGSNYQHALITLPQTVTVTQDLSTFIAVVNATEYIANAIITSHYPVDVQVHIDDQIIQADNHVDGVSTSSLGSTTSETIDGHTIRQNAKKVSKYGGAPKRFIQLGGIETSPCCGTHVSSLNQLHGVSILNIIKNGSRYRLYFVCGDYSPAYSRYQSNQLQGLKSMLSTHQHQIVPMVGKLQQELVDTRKQYASIKDQLYGFICHELYTQYSRYLGEQGKRLPPSKDEPDQATQEDEWAPNTLPILHYSNPLLSLADLQLLSFAFNDHFRQIHGTDHDAKRPYLFLTTFDSSDYTLPGQFYIAGHESNANHVKILGSIVGKALNAKGGGRPGLFQGKAVNGEQLPAVLREMNAIGANGC